MKVKIIKECYLLKEERKLNVGDIEDFDNERAEALISQGFVEKVIERKTKEKKQTHKKK